MIRPGGPALLVALGLAACGATEPTGDPRLSFFNQAVFGFPTRATTVEDGGDRIVEVKGIIVTPSVLQQITGALTIEGPHQLRLDVIGTRLADGGDVETRFFYIGTISNLGRGDYSLAVYHIRVNRLAADSTLMFTGTISGN
ncbi:MAG: hypothetical protein ABI647_12520 [Gemmatimonadota bacterium]